MRRGASLQQASGRGRGMGTGDGEGEGRGERGLGFRGSGRPITPGPYGMGSECGDQETRLPEGASGQVPGCG